MIYLTLEDLKTDNDERFIRESTADFTAVLDKAEQRAIGMVKPFLRDRYQVEAIFDPVAPLRNEMLVEILVSFTLYKIHRRNAARKFTADESLKRANALLDKIASGKITLDLPGPIDENGRAEHSPSWGNLTNEDFYI